MGTLGIIGGGVLGKAIARGFMEHCDVRVHDAIKERSTHPIEEAATADIVMIALPTPAKPDGKCDTSAIDKFLNQARTEEWWTKESCYVIRSTVPIGYTGCMATQYFYGSPLFHSPEFLTARCAMTDFQTPARNIIGSPEGSLDHGYAKWVDAYSKLKSLYETRFPGVPVHLMSSDASELVKLACNSFFAAKVTLFNLFYDLTQQHKLDWESVRGGILSDGRIAHAHTQVPSFGQLGFGGACLPKDVADLFHCCRDAGVNAELLRAVIERNEETRRPNDEALLRIELPR